MVCLNKKGSSIFISFMLGIVFFILGMALAPAIVQASAESMLDLNCTTNYLVNDSVTNQNKAVCTQLDLFAPLFTGILFGLGGMLVGAIAIR